MGTDRIDTFDLNHWQSELADCLEQKIQSAIYSDSPLSVVLTEHYRRLAAEFGALGPHVPTDRFVFASGEPPARHLTKVNGLPYRPADRPWPLDGDGYPMTFLVQFCLADSKDHLDGLPGDVLLVFVPTNRAYWTARQIIWTWEPFAYEWYPLGLDNLVTSEQIPPNPGNKPPPPSPITFKLTEPVKPLVFPTCFGVRHRSVDYVDLAGASDLVSRVVPQELMPTNEFVSNCTLQALCRFPGMKIGGLPLWRWKEPPIVEGRFLGSFGGVSVISECSFPWTNQPEPIDLRTSTSDENFLLFGDGKSLNFFLRNDGEVDCYEDGD